MKFFEVYKWIFQFFSHSLSQVFHKCWSFWHFFCKQFPAQLFICKYGGSSGCQFEARQDCKSLDCFLPVQPYWPFRDTFSQARSVMKMCKQFFQATLRTYKLHMCVLNWIWPWLSWIFIRWALRSLQSVRADLKLLLFTCEKTTDSIYTPRCVYGMYTVGYLWLPAFPYKELWLQEQASRRTQEMKHPCRNRAPHSSTLPSG